MFSYDVDEGGDMRMLTEGSPTVKVGEGLTLFVQESASPLVIVDKGGECCLRSGDQGSPIVIVNRGGICTISGGETANTQIHVYTGGILYIKHESPRCTVFIHAQGQCISKGDDSSVTLYMAKRGHYKPENNPAKIIQM